MKYLTTIIEVVVSNMRNITSPIHAFIPLQKIITKDLPKPMGRWNIDYCNKKIDNKIDLSNEDHCGPCGQYALSKTVIENNAKDKT